MSGSTVDPQLWQTPCGNRSLWVRQSARRREHVWKTPVCGSYSQQGVLEAGLRSSTGIGTFPSTTVTWEPDRFLDSCGM